MTDIDKQKLLNHLDNRIQTYENVVCQAVVDGLRTAVIRGDFDKEQEAE